MTLPFSVTSETMRRIEWWALLNAFRVPSDLPRETNHGALFRELSHEIPSRLRMEFWNGAFGGGKNWSRFL